MGPVLHLPVCMCARIVNVQESVWLLIVAFEDHDWGQM
jgi:hypothetical protein